MKNIELLAVKEILNTENVNVLCGITATGSPVGFRLRVSIATPLYDALFKPLKQASQPKVQLFGDIAQGLAIILDSHTGSAPSRQSASTVTFTAAIRGLSGAENRVPSETVPAVLTEYTDGSRALILGPLPDKFLSNSRQKLRADGDLTIFTAVEKAFLASGQIVAVTGQKSVEIVAPQPAPAPLPEAEAEPEVVAKGEAQPQGIVGRPEVSDLRDLLTMINEQVSKLHMEGAGVALRIDDEGLVRAQVTTVIDL